jgi:hypothetical protein
LERFRLPLQVVPRRRLERVRIGDATARGYTREDLHDALERYLPALTDPLRAPARSATSATGATNGEKDSVFNDTTIPDVADVAEKRVADVADIALAAGGERVCAQWPGLQLTLRAIHRL